MKAKAICYGALSLMSLGAVSVEMHKQIGTVGMLRLAGVKVPEIEKKVEVEKIKEVTAPKVTFEQALKNRVETSSVPSVIVEGILNQESGGNFERMSLTRYEPSYAETAKRITRNPDEQRMWASSWCPFQIMAPHARRFDLDWSDLLEPETCVHVGMSILEECWKLAKGKGRAKVYNLGLCYNGPQGQAYATRLAEQVGNAAINRILEGEG